MRIRDREKNAGKQKQPINPFRNFAAKVWRQAAFIGSLGLSKGQWFLRPTPTEHLTTEQL
jgi:hypothetical protein